LLIKNQTQPDSPFYTKVTHTLGLLRVMESVRNAEGNEPIGKLYAAYGEQIHHQGNAFVEASSALRDAGLSTSHADAASDDSFDASIRAHMDAGLALTGNDVGTPILGFAQSGGKQVGFFGPVISRRMTVEHGLRLWDGLMLTADIDCFWELKRTRTENPDFTPMS
jgi:hypothetical protein